MANEVPKLTPSQLKVLLSASIKARANVLVSGAPGIGKTQILIEATRDAGADLIISHPAVEDPTDVKGLPWLNGTKKNEATFLPFGALAQALNAKKLTVWFLDDLGQATPAMQAAYMQLLHGGRVNGHQIPDCVVFVAATNRRTDKAGVTGILEPVKSRFGTIVELIPDIDDFSRWAFKNLDPNAAMTLVPFLRFRAELLSKFEPSADLTNSPSPRTWEKVARWETLQLPQEIEAAAMSGAVGAGAAGEYLAFRVMARQLPNLDGIITNPKKAAIPTEMSKLFAISIGLARKANVGNFGRITQYAERMLTEANRGEFAVLMMREVQRLDEDQAIQHTHDYIQMTLGPVGEQMDGRNIK